MPSLFEDLKISLDTDLDAGHKKHGAKEELDLYWSKEP